MPAQPSETLREYRHTLYDYAVGGGEPALRRALVLQRQASAEGCNALEMLEAHHATVLPILMPASSPEKAVSREKSVRLFCTSCPSWDPQLSRDFVDRDAVADCLQRRAPASADQPAPPVEPLIVLRHLNQVLGEEKRPFARIVDNEAAQLLAVANLRLSMAASDLPPGCSHCFIEIKKFLEQIQVQLPPAMLYDPDFLPALKTVAESTLQGTGIAVTVEGSAGATLPQEIQAAILRIAEEALTNVVRHAYAGTVKVRGEVRDNREFYCSIADDGVGFAPADVLSGKAGHGVGLLGMERRVQLLGGKLAVTSGRGKGTEIVVRLPLER
ncbi:MAG: ATP-binding protein [Acidobacteriia bacterium]|nr:ATP-binding protein [Terriglobia bacterium]